jgi:hypothetical protein
MKRKTVVVPDQPSPIKRVFDPREWFIFASWGGRGEDSPPTTDGRFLHVGYDSQGRKLWAGPFF